MRHHRRGARRCTNEECEYGGHWVVRKMRVLRKRRFSCLGNSSGQDAALYQRRGPTEQAWSLAGEPSTEGGAAISLPICEAAPAHEAVLRRLRRDQRPDALQRNVGLYLLGQLF